MQKKKIKNINNYNGNIRKALEIGDLILQKLFHRDKRKEKSVKATFFLELFFSPN